MHRTSFNHILAWVEGIQVYSQEDYILPWGNDSEITVKIHRQLFKNFLLQYQWINFNQIKACSFYGQGWGFCSNKGLCPLTCRGVNSIKGKFNRYCFKSSPETLGQYMYSKLNIMHSAITYVRNKNSEIQW